MRFQLDPRAPPPERPQPPPARAPTPSSAPAPVQPGPSAAPAVEAPPPPLPRPRPAAGPGKAAPPKGRGRLYALLLVGVLLLAGGGTAAMYALELPPFEYPRRYMLEGDELPRGMALTPTIPDVARDVGITENPGQIPPDELERFGEGPAPQPEDGWAEAISPPGRDAPVVIAALRFADEDDARRWVSLLSLRCGSVGGALLRDGEVAVLVIAQGSAAEGYLSRVVDSLKAEAPDLRVVCGPGR